MNFTNAYNLRFHISKGSYTIYYLDYDMGSGKLSTITLDPHIVHNVRSPAVIYGDNNAMHEKLEQVKDKEVEFNVEMEIVGRLAAWSFETDANFFVSCSVLVDKLAESSVVTQSTCYSYR